MITPFEWFGSRKLHSSAAGPSKASDNESSWLAGLPIVPLLEPTRLLNVLNSSPSILALGTDQDGLERLLCIPPTKNGSTKCK